MTELKKILVVDDAKNILSSMKRQFRKQYDIHTAEQGEEALSILDAKGPFCVVVSDMQMPGMNGAELLTQIKKRSPDTIRILLTGQADMDAAISAVNDGQIYRFLTKPCPMTTLSESLEESVRMHDAQKNERELLERTLKGSISLLVELMNLISPTDFCQANRVKHTIKYLTKKLALGNRWEYEVAAMLCGIGTVTLPNELRRKIYNNEELDAQERKLSIEAPSLGASLLKHIPRLENVAQMIRRQRFILPYGLDKPNTLRGHDRIVFGGHMLKVALAFDSFIEHGVTPQDAIAKMEANPAGFNRQLVSLLKDVPTDNTRTKMQLPLKGLRIGMTLDDDVYDSDDQLVLAKGYRLTQTMLLRLKTFTGNKRHIREPIKVIV